MGRKSRGWEGKLLLLMLSLPWRPMNHVGRSLVEGVYLIHLRETKKSPNHNREDSLAAV